MENWIIMICLINNRLVSQVESYDRRIMKLALKHTKSSLFDCQQVARAMNNKNMLINLKILYDHIYQAVGAEGVEAIKHVVTRERIREYCNKNSITHTVMMRRVKIAFSKAKNELLKLSYNLTKFEKDYADVQEVMSLYTKISDTNWQRRLAQTCVKKKTNEVLLATIIRGDNGYISASTSL